MTRRARKAAEREVLFARLDELLADTRRQLRELEVDRAALEVALCELVFQRLCLLADVPCDRVHLPVQRPANR